METKIIWPQHYREDAFPKAQVQKPDSEEPCADPHGPHEGMLLYPYLLRTLSVGVSFGCHNLLRIVPHELSDPA